MKDLKSPLHWWGWGKVPEIRSQSTQIGNGHLLVYIPSWKNQPRLVGTPPPFTESTSRYKAVVYSLAEREDTLPLFLLYPYVYGTLWIRYSALRKCRNLGRKAPNCHRIH